LEIKSEPVGGSYGISKPIKVNNHLIFNKYGDYNGRVIIVNDKGQIFNIIGGENFYDAEKELLFTIYDSDLSGFAIFDLKKDTLIFEMLSMENRPISFHKDFEDRYFLLTDNDVREQEELATWEIELDENRIMSVDLDTTRINKSNMLKKWSIGDTYCECEK
jgi:hypothetical protein